MDGELKKGDIVHIGMFKFDQKNTYGDNLTLVDIDIFTRGGYYALTANNVFLKKTPTCNLFGKKPNNVINAIKGDMQWMYWTEFNYIT